MAKRSFDGGRERGKSLNDAVRPLSLSLADARQLPRQREPRKRKFIGCLAEGAKGIEKLTDLHKKQDNKHIQKLRYLVAICHYVKPPSDEGGGKTKVLTEGEKEEKLKGCNKTSLPQPR